MNELLGTCSYCGEQLTSGGCANFRCSSRTPAKCGTTHHTGCACWEAQRDAKIAELERDLAQARTRLAAVEKAIEGYKDGATIAVGKVRRAVNEGE